MRPLPDLTSADLRVVSRWLDDDGSLRILREPSSADLIAAVCAGVESGTIEGKVQPISEMQRIPSSDPIPEGWRELFETGEWRMIAKTVGYELVIPVSGGGSET